MSFNDSILQKIWRDFPESESIAFCKKEINDLRFEIGVMKSDLDEERDLRIKLERQLQSANDRLKEKVNYQAKIDGLKANIVGLERQRDKLQVLLYEKNLPRHREITK